MNRKYIVTNCPAYNINTNHCRNEIIADCKDITYCVMKQIVRECKMNMSDDDFEYILKHKNDEGIFWLTDSSRAILNILRLLEIEEVDE